MSMGVFVGSTNVLTSTPYFIGGAMISCIDSSVMTVTSGQVITLQIKSVGLKSGSATENVSMWYIPI